MRDGQGPKYVNTREGEVFTKGRQLFGVDIARAAAAKAGAVILAEGYTDVIALHQAGFANAVASMGTALTAEQANELGNLAPLVLLCLDADAAGQTAAARAASVLPARLELRVVPLPPGADPADIVGEEGGADRMRALLDRAMPFARFQVERTLERASGADATAQDTVLDDVAAVIRPLQGGIVRDDLVKLVSGRLGISPELIESAVRSTRSPGVSAHTGEGQPPRRQADGARQALDRRQQSERAFLALCIALPELGEKKLAEADLDTVFTSPLTRLAADRLRGHLTHPAAILADTPELADLIPEIVLRAGQLDATPATLELEALQLDLHRLDREITAARTGAAEGAMSTLAAERQRVLDAIRHRLQ
jgi:DNA primase